MSRRRENSLEKGLSWKALKAEWLNWYGRKKPVLHFGLKFGALIALFYGLLALPFFDRALYAYLEANAWTAGSLLALLGQGTHVSGVTITSPHFAIAIRRGCDAVEPTWLLCAAILAFPAPLLHKLQGILAGILLLQLLNLVRIVTLYWIGIHSPALFNTAHMEIWPVFFILVALLLFMGWKTWSPALIKFPVHTPLFAFLGRFVLIYGILIIPWPGWNQLYAEYFQGFGRIAFSREEGPRVVLFQTHDLHYGFSSVESRMILGNKNLADSSGKGLAEIVELDTRSIGWIPTALTAALILASPIPWRRRCWSFLAGMLLIHGLILFSLQTWIWDESTAVSLARLSPAWQRVADAFEFTFMTQIGVGFSVPIVIWILVTFRRADAQLFTRAALFGPGKPPRPHRPARQPSQA